MSSKVFVVQRPAYYSREKRGWVNKYDLSPAEKFGELSFLLRPGNIFRDRLDDAMKEIRDRLTGYSSEDDYILAVGDPVAIAATVVTAYEIGQGPINILKFDRQLNEYQPYRVKVRKAPIEG